MLIWTLPIESEKEKHLHSSWTLRTKAQLIIYLNMTLCYSSDFITMALFFQESPAQANELIFILKTWERPINSSMDNTDSFYPKYFNPFSQNLGVPTSPELLRHDPYATLTKPPLRKTPFQIKPPIPIQTDPAFPPFETLLLLCKAPFFLTNLLVSGKLSLVLSTSGVAYIRGEGGEGCWSRASD